MLFINVTKVMFDFESMRQYVRPNHDANIRTP